MDPKQKEKMARLGVTEAYGKKVCREILALVMRGNKNCLKGRDNIYIRKQGR